jgi:hypothetical protein
MSTARKYTIELDNRDLKEVGNLILGMEIFNEQY